MTAETASVRRATVEDLPQLIALWRMERLPWETLEKNLTEFQVAADGAGCVLGAVGVKIAGHQGLIHSEVFLDFAQADALRELLWTRIQTLATNHALHRLWTRETAPFWTHNGFREASQELAAKLPAIFTGEPQKTLWTLELRPEPETQPVDLDREFAMFREAEKQSLEAAFRHARTLKIVALIVALVVFAFVIVGGVILIKRMSPGG